MDAEARLLARSGGAVASRTVARIDKALKALGCESYVKTIYVGYQYAGSMVVAVYPGKTTQVALALAEDTEGADLIDATHLTWPTMPLAILVASEDQIERAVDLATRAAQRIRQGEHDVDRPPEYFMSRREKGGPPRPSR